jgi:hypothetical protein
MIGELKNRCIGALSVEDIPRRRYEHFFRRTNQVTDSRALASSRWAEADTICVANLLLGRATVLSKSPLTQLETGGY